jgi:hypothetical protein
METDRSDVGYPEEQPDRVHDKTTKPEKDSKDKDAEHPPPDDGKATGNPRN